MQPILLYEGYGDGDGEGDGDDEGNGSGDISILWVKRWWSSFSKSEIMIEDQ